MGGTIKGNYIANSYSPYLEIRWDDLERDVANNRTKVRARLYFKKDTNSRINYQVRYKGTLTINGNKKSFNAGGQYLNGSRAFSVQIAEHTVWVPHNSDGTKTVRFDGTYTAGITWSGVYHGTMRVGGSGTLPRIPRQSTITSFSFPNSLNGGASSVNFELNVPLSGAKHTIRVKMGSTLIKELTNQGNISSMDLSATQVGNMLKRVTTASRGQATLEVITYSGGNQIGSTQSRNANFTIDINHANLRPSITDFTNFSHRSATTAVEARLGEYYKNISHVRASFSAGTKYGATRVTSGINIRSSNGNDTNYISGLDGVTASKVNQSGDYTLEAFVTDSRGAKTTQSVTISVNDYTPITITSFTGTRRASNPSIIDVRATINTSHYPFLYDLDYRKASGSGATSKFTFAEGTTSSSSTITYALTNTDRAASYEFRLSASDRFNRVETKVSVTTERALISFNKDKGIGIGKIHERGVLDVGGSAYFTGNLYSNNTDITQGNHANYKTFTVGGNADNYYPVTIGRQGRFAWNRYSISRHYSAPAPDTWNTATHKGGLTFSFEWTGDHYWGGNRSEVFRVIALEENYSTMVGGMDVSLSGIVVWLRGGGAQYTLHSERGSQANVNVHLNGFTESSTKRSFPVRNNNLQVYPQVYTRYPVRGDGRYLYQNGERVLDSGVNDNGNWVRFGDGTQICYKEGFHVGTYVSNRVMRGDWTLPKDFIAEPRVSVFVTKNEYSGANAVNKASVGSYVPGGSKKAYVYYFFGDDAPASSGLNLTCRVMAIGRWK